VVSQLKSVGAPVDYTVFFVENKKQPPIKFSQQGFSAYFPNHVSYEPLFMCKMKQTAKQFLHDFGFCIRNRETEHQPI
jgi:hypothetical protein